MRTVKLTGQVVALAAVAGLLGLLVWRLTHESKPPRIGGPAPGFASKRVDVSGKTLDLASLRGKPVVLNFWASWCGPCKDEAPALEELSKKYAGRVVVVGLDSQDATGDARAFAERYHLTYPIVHATGNEIYQRWGLAAFPETFILDRNQRVVHHFAGPVTAADVEAQLGPLLGSSA